MSNEIDVSVIFRAVLVIDVYLSHIGHWYDSIPEFWIWLVICVACWCIVSLTFAEVAPRSGSGWRRNWWLLLSLRFVNEIVLLDRCVVLLVHKSHSCPISHSISGGQEGVMTLIRSASFSRSYIALWSSGDYCRGEGGSFLIWYNLDVVVPWVVLYGLLHP